VGAITKIKRHWPDATRRAWFMQGVQDLLPTMIATSVWGFVTGVAMLKSGLTEAMASWMTVLVYAGSAQLTSLPLIESRSPLWLVFVAACVVNIRFVIFSAAMYPFFRHLSWKKRLGLGYLTGDISFVLFMARFGESAQRGIPQHVWYLMGAVVPGWISWQVASIAGIFFGTFIPDAWSLEFAAVLALLAVLLPLVATRPLFACLVVAGVVAWAGQQLPLRLGLLAAVICGVIAGVVVEQLQRKRTTP